MMPRALQLLDQAALDPAVVQMMGEVLDAAWHQIKPVFRGKPQRTVDNARLILARTILHLVKEALVHPGILKDEAIFAVRDRYPAYTVSGATD